MKSETELDPKFEMQDDPDYGSMLIKVFVFLIVVSIMACIAGMAIVMYGSWMLQLCSVIAVLLLISYLWVRWKINR